MKHSIPMNQPILCNFNILWHVLQASRGPTGSNVQTPSFAPSQPSAASVVIPPPPIPPPPPMSMSLLAYNAQQQQQHIKGHESECNFTPSPNSSLAHHPLDPMPGAGVASTPPSKLFGTLPSDQGSPIQRPPPFNFMTSNRRYRNGSPSSVSSSSFIGEENV